ncbi:glycoside hydrolase family 26 protein [Atractiella rhizophila]|nr:glycoside hydrolase family 26 protein [Atractiella rhizophila]
MKTSSLPTRNRGARDSSSIKSALLAGSIFVSSLLSMPAPVNAAPYEPPGNQVLFGAWIDPAAGYSDTPTWFNERLGLNVPVYQLSQPIPLPKYDYVTGAGGPAPEPLLEKSGTDSAFFLTVYPTSLDAVTQADMDALADQIRDYHVLNNRTVFVRYAPEMQGNWFPYGQKPVQFIQQWRQVYTTLKAKAPEVIMVWAPNTGQGYPYVGGWGDITAENQAVLDTNGNGNFDNGDDPYSPYWPGIEYVDWAGLSVYYKGTGDDTTNTVQTTGYCGGVFDGTNNVGNNSNFYADYCARYNGLACMMSESGAAYHEADLAGATALQLQTAWINDCITSATFLDSHPRLKLIMHFEHEKAEQANDGTSDMRDYRITNHSNILAVLQAGFAGLGDRFSWANVREIPTSISSPGSNAPITDSLGHVSSTPPPVVSATTRPRDNQFPLLFGNKIDPTKSDGMMTEIIEISTIVLAAIGGTAVVFRWL